MPKRTSIFGSTGLIDPHLCDRFIRQNLRQKALTIFGNSSQTRSFCYINNLVEGIIKLLYSDYTNLINIENTDEISIFQPAKEINTFTKDNLNIIYKLPKNDSKQRQLDISRAKEILNWQLKSKHIDGLKKTYNFYKTFLSQASTDKSVKS